MAQSRIQIGPCCTVPRGGEPYVDRWDVWRLPARLGRGARHAEIARLRAPERERPHPPRRPRPRRRRGDQA